MCASGYTLAIPVCQSGKIRVTHKKTPSGERARDEKHRRVMRLSPDVKR
jgi:hypothetical protein